MNKVNFLSCAFLSMSFALLADIEGDYNVHGFDADYSTTYDATATITKNGENYAITWNFGDDNIDNGVGIRKDHHISFNFQNATDPAETGVEVLKIKDGSLKGTWARLGSDVQGFEILEKIN